MPAQKGKINLLPPSEFEESFWGRFLKWAVSTGRYIIILTELVVIMAFLSRFKLDSDLADLNEQINSQVSFLKSKADEEREFVSLKTRMALVDKILDNRQSVVGTWDYLDLVVPPELVLSEMTIQKGGVSFSASTISEKSISVLVSNMNKDEQWKSLDMTNLVSDRSGLIKFQIKASR